MPPAFQDSGQLTLPVQLDDSATLENFYVPEGSANEATLEAIDARESQSLYIWGGEGAGITHLLQGLCHQADQYALASIYIPLNELAADSPEQVLAGLESLDLVCLDELESVVTDEQWAEQLFHFYNRAALAGSKIAFGARSSPTHLQTPLADLHSRLCSLLIHRVDKLSDDEIVQALVFRALRRGLDMSESVAEYLVTRFSRKLSDQFKALDVLDHASLAEQRKLTVPFVKSILEG